MVSGKPFQDPFWNSSVVQGKMESWECKTLSLSQYLMPMTLQIVFICGK